MSVLLPGVYGWGRGRVESSSGDLGAAAPAVVAAAAAGGRGHRPSPGTRLRPVRLHDLFLRLEHRVVAAPRLPGRWRRGAYHPSETQVLVLDVLHLYPLAGVRSLGRPAGLALGSDSRRTHGGPVSCSERFRPSESERLSPKRG